VLEVTDTHVCSMSFWDPCGWTRVTEPLVEGIMIAQHLL
jgi:hypothetical protein